MKWLRLIAVTALLSPSSVFAQATTGDIQQQMMQQIQNMSPQEREALVASIQKNASAMQECLNEAGGEAALKELQTIGDAHQEHVKNLCTKGDRAQAQAYAQDASAEMLKDPRVEKLRNCSRMAMQNMPQLSQIVETGGLDTSKHVCD